MFQVDVADFALTKTGTANGAIASVSGSGTTYTVTVNTITDDGTLRLDLNGGTNVIDAAGNAAPAFTSGSVVTIDNIKPVIKRESIRELGRELGGWRRY